MLAAMAFVQIFFMFPETKGRTIEEMEAVFSAGHVFSAWAVPADIGKKSLEEVVPKVRSGCLFRCSMD